MQHTPKQLRKFARAFQDAAARERAKADRLENKSRALYCPSTGIGVREMTRKIGKSPLLGAPYGQATGAEISYLPVPGVSKALVSAMADAHREVATIIGIDLASKPDKTAVAIRTADGRYVPLCSDCPPLGYPHKTRCAPCPRKRY
jgi:hypothetical protein